MPIDMQRAPKIPVGRTPANVARIEIEPAEDGSYIVTVVSKADKAAAAGAPGVEAILAIGGGDTTRYTFQNAAELTTFVGDKLQGKPTSAKDTPVTDETDTEPDMGDTGEADRARKRPRQRRPRRRRVARATAATTRRRTRRRRVAGISGGPVPAHTTRTDMLDGTVNLVRPDPAAVASPKPARADHARGRGGREGRGAQRKLVQLVSILKAGESAYPEQVQQELDDLNRTRSWPKEFRDERKGLRAGRTRHSRQTLPRDQQARSGRPTGHQRSAQCQALDSNQAAARRGQEWRRCGRD
jgi:hypothetical protein